MTARPLALMAAIALPAPALAISLPEVTSFFVFGDSLSDWGNLPNVLGPFANAVVPSPPYSQFRFTDGEVWSEVVAREAGPMNNFAFGGARADGISSFVIPDFDGQIDLYADFLDDLDPDGSVGAAPLASVWFGANDIFDAFEDGGLAAAVPDAVDAIVDGIARLTGLGIDDFLVFNLPDLSRTPLFLGGPAAAAARDVTVQFNGLLEAALRDVTADVTLFDANALFADLLDDPVAFGERFPAAAGITVVDEACLDDALLFFLICDDPGSYVFFDGVHPTQQVHAALGAAVIEALAPIPLPAGAPLLLMGVGALALARRRAA